MTNSDEIGRRRRARFLICALGASQPGTMGGNTKIAVEMARCLAEGRETHVFLPRYKLPTFTDNLPSGHKVRLHTLDDFPGDDKFHPFAVTRWYTSRVRALFRELGVGADDFVFSCSDFHCDVLPIAPLEKEFGFRWIPSVFLFVPFIVENLRRGYRFPPLKYLVYWFYQRALFAVMKRRATGFVVTNECDFRFFPKRFRDGRLFAYYGGVNVEQIPRGRKKIGVENRCTVLFCSRLHPQKGIDAFLDTWKQVLNGLKSEVKGQTRNNASSVQHSTFNLQPHLTIIGNGDPSYETYLRDKAIRLGIADTISWLGYVNNEAKYEIYAKADLFVHPTIFDNNGMVAAEALCTGLPVVMQDLPNLRHVYTTGCAKVPYGDKRAFAAKIVELITDPDKLAALAPSPAQVAALRDHWRWESRAREFENWLGDLTANESETTKKGPPHAPGTGNALHDRPEGNDGGGLHPFASRRKQTLSDLGRIRVLEEALRNEPRGNSDRNPRESVRLLISAARQHGLFISKNEWTKFGDCVSKRTGESAVYFNSPDHAYYKARPRRHRVADGQTHPVNEPIHIALAANHNYINGLLVTMVSMIRSASDKSRLRFHIFSDGMLPEDKEAVLAFAAEYGITEPAFVEPDMAEIKNRFEATAHYPHTIYIRLFYCDILTDLDWIVYTDVDTLWLRDVCELWDLRDDAASVCWCRDLPSIAAGIHKYSKWNPDFDESRYCCSGVMLMNLRRLRERNFTARCVDFVATWGTSYFPDQDILNHLCRADAKILPQYWNTMMPTREAVHGLVYHFTGIGKRFNGLFTGWRPLYYPWYRFFYDFILKTPNRPVCGPFKRLVFWLLGTFYPNRRLISFLVRGRLDLTDNIERQLFFAWLGRRAKMGRTVQRHEAMYNGRNFTPPESRTSFMWNSKGSSR